MTTITPIYYPIFAYVPLTVEIDGCEYLLAGWGNTVVFTHKGNCKFCAQRNKK